MLGICLKSLTITYKKKIGQAMQRRGGNLYTDVGDVLSVAKVKKLSIPNKKEVLPGCKPHDRLCDNDGKNFAHPDGVSELLNEVLLQDKETLFRSNYPPGTAQCRDCRKALRLKNVRRIHSRQELANKKSLI